jgi:peptidyl-prolyl cis-trans isomerase C
VGSEIVQADTVARIAARQGVSLTIANDHAVADARLAAEARASLPAGARRTIDRAAAARTVLEELMQQARQAGAPSQQELDDIVAERWVELDRPTAVRTTHAVVRNERPERDAAAHTLADKLAQALAHASTSEAFVALAKSFPADGFQIVAEPLPFIAADGRAFDRNPPHEGFAPLLNTRMDLAFAAGAIALETPGQQSPVVKSAFGYHVIRLEERLPGSKVPRDQLATLLLGEVQLRRATAAKQQLLTELRGRTNIELDRAQDTLTARLSSAQ